MTYKAAIHDSVTQATRLGMAKNKRLFDYPAFNPIARVNQQANFVGLPAD